MSRPSQTVLLICIWLLLHSFTQMAVQTHQGQHLQDLRRQAYACKATCRVM